MASLGWPRAATSVPHGQQLERIEPGRFDLAARLTRPSKRAAERALTLGLRDQVPKHRCRRRSPQVQRPPPACSVALKLAGWMNSVRCNLLFRLEFIVLVAQD